MIKEIENKMDYDQILTISDPNINLVRNYLQTGTLYGYYLNNEPVSFIVVETIDGEVEIKNILTLVEHRGHGYAKALIKFIESKYAGYSTFLISTANSSFENIIFYTRLGYVYSHRIDNFFIDYYPKAIIENEMKATDLMYFKKSIHGLN